MRAISTMMSSRQRGRILGRFWAWARLGRVVQHDARRAKVVAYKDKPLLLQTRRRGAAGEAVRAAHWHGGHAPHILRCAARGLTA
jgi:hypothetical protein